MNEIIDIDRQDRQDDAPADERAVDHLAADHRAIANRMELYHQQEEAAGMAFWHPRGFALYRAVEDYVRRRMRRAGFREIRTPQLLSRGLWEKSGHWEKFRAGMYAFGEDEAAQALKPMSCPAHIQIFRQRQRSFRDLPLRYCEFGACHRDEPSGALYGLMRTRAFTQDDAHIFCAPEQVEGEVARFCRMLGEVYRDFGFSDVRVAFSTRPDQRAGSEADWDRAEAMLAAAARAAGLYYEVAPGEGAFYGPKLDFHLRDSHGREWQCGTVQLDRVLPERLDVHYVDSGGERVRPIMIHHAVLGSVERFIGVLLEHHGGDLPLWLAPDQVLVASVDEGQADYAERVAERFERAGFRAATDPGPARVARKVVEARRLGIPVFAAVGAREAAAGTVSLRRRDGRQVVLTVAEAIDVLRPEAIR